MYSEYKTIYRRNSVWSLPGNGRTGILAKIVEKNFAINMY